MAQFIAIQLLNSLVYSMLLFLLALGLSLTFGLLRVVNLAHGAFFLLGAYFGMTVWSFTHSFMIAVAVAPIGAGLVGALLDELERRNLKRGVATLCAAGGIGIATVIERV